MAEISAADVKKLRELTGAGMMDCKKALVETDGDLERAVELLRTKGMAKAQGRAGERTASDGIVHAYLHQPSPGLPPKVGVLLQLNCETDFVAKTEPFGELAKEIALHIAFADPLYLRRDDVPNEVVEAERRIYEATAREEGKPEAALEKIVEGRVAGYYKAVCLLEQEYARDNKKTIANLLDEASAQLGEKIEVGRFTRYKIGR